MLLKKIVKQPALLLIIITITSKFLGFGRELVIANYFGTDKSLDIFLLAFTVPNIIISITMYAFPNSIIPKLGNNIEPSYYQRLVSAFVRIYFFVSVIIALFLFFASDIFASLVLRDTANYDIHTVSLIIKYLSFYTLFFNTFNIIKSIYQSEKRFVFPAVTQFSVHLVLIISVILFSGRYGYYSLVFGVIGGTLLQLLIVLFDFLHERGIRFLFSYEKNLKILDTTFLTLIFIEVINQVYLFIDRFFASSLPSGSISSLNYANILTQLPVSIFALSIGVVVFTKFRDNVNKKKAIIDNTLLKKLIAIILFFSLSSIVLYYIFPEFIVNTIFLRGAFDNKAVQLTVEALKYFTIGIPFIMIHVVLTKIAFVKHKEFFVLFSNIIGIITKILIIYYTLDNLQHAALALSTSIAFIVNVLILTILLSIKKRWTL